MTDVVSKGVSRILCAGPVWGAGFNLEIIQQIIQYRFTLNTLCMPNEA